MSTKCVLNKSTMTNIADAIRAKGGTSASMLPSAMPAAIASINTDEDAWMHPEETEYTGDDLLLYIDIPYDGFEFYHYANSFNATYPIVCDWGDGSDPIYLSNAMDEKKSHVYASKGHYLIRMYPKHPENPNCIFGHFRSSWGGIFYFGVENQVSDGVSACVRKMCVGAKFVARYQSMLGGMQQLKYLLCANIYPVILGQLVFVNCNVSGFANLSHHNENDGAQPATARRIMFFGSKSVKMNLKNIFGNLFQSVYSASIQHIVLGSATAVINNNSFNYTVGLADFTCEATTPPTATESTSLGSWYALDSFKAAYVPSSSLSAYLIAPYWCLFGSKMMPINATPAEKEKAASGGYMAEFTDGVITGGAAYDAQLVETSVTVTWDSAPFTTDQVTAIETLMISKNYTMSWR